MRNDITLCHRTPKVRLAQLQLKQKKMSLQMLLLSLLLNFIKECVVFKLTFCIK